MISAFIAAISGVAEVVQGKYILSKEHVPFKAFLVLQCVMIFFSTVFLYIFFGEINFSALSLIHYVIFGIIVLVALAYNYLWTYSMKMGKIKDVEPIAMVYPLFTMIIAVTFYPDERNFAILIPALIAGAALVYSRIEKHHLKINKYSMYMLGFAVLIAIEQNLVKFMLEVFSPVAFYTLRIGVVSALFLIFLKPNFKKIDRKISFQMFINGAIIAIEYVLIYVAIEQIGLVNTSLIMLLSPVLILFISNYLFKEKTTMKKALADVIIIVCIASAILIT